nr:S8 family serine peptidase [Pseudomarimonas arenosa]
MLSDQAALALRGSNDVELVERVPEHKLLAQVTPWNVDQFQARDIWDKDRNGEVDPGAPDGTGIKVCIIDTGFYAPHDDFQGITVDGHSQISGEQWSEDGNGHGTHVAGTVNAMNNDVGVVGVLPGKAELFIVKIFNNSGVWSSGESDLAAAAETCRDNGANVISMSLGGPSSSVERDVFQDLYDNDGILHVAAAGNDGDNSASYPAGYPSVVSVAAIDQAEVAADFTQYPPTANDPNSPPANSEWDVVELAGGGVNVLSTWPGPPHGGVPAYLVNVGGSEFSANGIEGAGAGTVSAELVSGGLCATGTGQPSWSGKVVICERGTVSFAEKVNTVKDAGGVAALLYNNAAGNFSGTCNSQCTTPLIPALSLSQADGQNLVANHIGAATTVTADDGSSCTDCIGGYNSISGTSMATPGVAAGMSFIWNACGGPAEVTNKELRLLLRDSAKDLSGQQPGGPAYGAGWDPSTGWGLVQLADALELGNQRFGSSCAIGLGVSPGLTEICSASASSLPFTLTLGDVFTGTANLSATNLPAGTSGNFSVNPVIHPVKQSVYTLSGLNGLAGGLYSVDFEAVDAADAGNRASGSVNLSVFAAAPAAITLGAPANNATDQSLRPTLSWTASSGASTYTVEVSTSSDFSSILATATVNGTSYTLPSELNPSTTYYWRVRAANICGSGANSQVRSFTTGVFYCATPGAAIPDNTPAGLNSTITVPSGAALTDLDVRLRATHTWSNDLTVTLTKVGSGTTIRLLEEPTTSAGGGCNGDNPNLIFDDAAASAANNSCVNANPGWTAGGRFRPVDALTAFNGTSLAGDWTLNVADNAGLDTGTLDEWCLMPAVSGGPSNQAPIIKAPMSNRSVQMGASASWDAAAAFEDPDGDDLQYSMTGAPGSLSIDADTGMITGTLLEAEISATPYVIEVTATDTGAMSVTTSFELVVTTVNDLVFWGGFED